MLNRHAIVLFLGNAALLLLRPVAELSGGLLGVPLLERLLPMPIYGALVTGFLLTLVGLLLDDGQASTRAKLGQLLQGMGVAFLFTDALLLLPTGGKGFHLALAESGIAFAVLGVLVEMRGRYGVLRTAAGLQILGDLLYVAAFVFGLLGRRGEISAVGWTFIAIAGSLGLYAALSNLLLQLSRVRNPQAGWRYRVLRVSEQGLAVKTPQGEATIDWRHVQSVERIDGRHLILILPSPLPEEMKRTGLPVEELRLSEEELVPETAPPPERYGFILHEQELGRPLAEAQALLQRSLIRPAAQA